MEMFATVALLLYAAVALGCNMNLLPQIGVMMITIAILCIRLICYPFCKRAREGRLYRAEEMVQLNVETLTSNDAGLLSAMRTKGKQDLWAKIRECEPNGEFTDSFDRTGAVELDASTQGFGGKHDVEWKRAADFMASPSLFGEEGPLPNDVGQGAVGDCYFLAALAAMAENPERIRALFINDEANSCGCYGVMLSKHGSWHIVWVDDHFPVVTKKESLFGAEDDEGDGPLKPLFVHSNGTNKLWPLLMEKAWVLLYGEGKYENINGGLPYFALHALSMSPTIRYECRDYSEAEMWSVLHSSEDSGCVMSAGCNDKPFMGLALLPCCRLGGRCCRLSVVGCGWCEALCLWCETCIRCLLKVGRLIFCPLRCLVTCPLTCLCCLYDVHGKGFKSLLKVLVGETFDGIVQGHAYTVLGTAEVPARWGTTARIVKIRNPWGKKEWKGLFSDGSCAWTDDALQIAEHGMEDDDDGVFWMHLSDFMSYFQTVAVCYTSPGNYTTLDKRPDGKMLGLMHSPLLDEDDDDELHHDACVPRWLTSSYVVTVGEGTTQAGIAVQVSERCQMFVTVDTASDAGDGLRGIPVLDSEQMWAVVIFDEDHNVVAKNLARAISSPDNLCLCVEELQCLDRQYTAQTSMSTTQLRVEPGNYVVMLAWPQELAAETKTHLLIHSTAPVSLGDIPAELSSEEEV
eukprot:TRINITY_DN20305_c0_g1_i1.p1 TRINITY_DN20305_c0_g1~~TRINITY_DN20305_c0_g1_i1.p1  ORF type:complete len:687 (-),score=109.67 TRINITY_DN20305_c0_g1_i1:65-2125(-)